MDPYTVETFPLLDLAYAYKVNNGKDNPENTDMEHQASTCGSIFTSVFTTIQGCFCPNSDEDCKYLNGDVDQMLSVSRSQAPPESDNSNLVLEYVLTNWSYLK